MSKLLLLSLLSASLLLNFTSAQSDGDNDDDDDSLEKKMEHIGSEWFNSIAATDDNAWKQDITI